VGAPLGHVPGRQAAFLQLLQGLLGLTRDVVEAPAQLRVAQHQRLPCRPFHGLAALAQGLRSGAQARGLYGALAALHHELLQRVQGTERAGAEQAGDQQKGQQQQLLERQAMQAVAARFTHP